MGWRFFDHGWNIVTSGRRRVVKYSIPALIFSVVGGALGQLLMKAGLQEINTTSITALLSGLRTEPGSALILLCGLTFYAVAMPAWIIALKRFELSVAYPLISLGYLIVYIGAYYWPGMNESITWQKTIGLSLIVVGVALASRASKSDEWVQYESVK